MWYCWKFLIIIVKFNLLDNSYCKIIFNYFFNNTVNKIFSKFFITKKYANSENIKIKHKHIFLKHAVYKCRKLFFNNIVNKNVIIDIENININYDVDFFT